MTIIEALNMADALKPNTYDQMTKIQWLSQLDLMVKHDVYDTHDVVSPIFSGYNQDTPLDTVLQGPGSGRRPGLISDVSVPQTGQGDYVDPVIPGVRGPVGGDDRHESRVAHRVRIHLVAELQEVLCALVGPAVVEFHLHRAPPSHGEMDDGVDLQPVLVAVVAHVSVHRLRVHPEVPHDHGFEQEPEGLRVVDQVIRASIQEVGGYRRIRDVAGVGCAYGGLGAQSGGPCREVVGEADVMEQPEISVDRVRADLYDRDLRSVWRVLPLRSLLAVASFSESLSKS